MSMLEQQGPWYFDTYTKHYGYVVRTDFSMSPGQLLLRDDVGNTWWGRMDRLVAVPSTPATSHAGGCCHRDALLAIQRIVGSTQPRPYTALSQIDSLVREALRHDPD